MGGDGNGDGDGDGDVDVVVDVDVDVERMACWCCWVFVRFWAGFTARDSVAGTGYACNVMYPGNLRDRVVHSPLVRPWRRVP